MTKKNYLFFYKLKIAKKKKPKFLTFNNINKMNYYLFYYCRFITIK